MKLIGHAFQSGRIDFLRTDNPWAFARIDSGMKDSQKDRIVFDPTQAPVQLVSAPVNHGEVPVWMEEMHQRLLTADSIYLQYKSGVLRFRQAVHEIGNDRQFITLGSQDECDHFAEEHWKRVRYLYALRRPGAFCFDINTLITHKATSLSPDSRRIELVARVDLTDTSGDPMISFDATGHFATAEIVEWRGTVKEGEVGRYAPENSHIDFTINQVPRPFTFLVEDRKEFHNFSYTFSGKKMEDQLSRLIKKRLADLARQTDQETAGS